jgi:hypothetical protein
MLEAPALAGNRSRRQGKRPAVRPPLDLSFRTVRPSLLDLRFCGDPWIVAHDDGRLAMYLGDYCLTNLEGAALDLPALNRLFDTMRHRRPRLRGQGIARRG